MRCPHLDAHTVVAVCRLPNQSYPPSEFELAEFCTTKRYLRCPLYGTSGITMSRLCELEVERAVG